MLDAFLEHPFFLNRHRQAPLLKERESFLSHLQQQGTSRKALRNLSGELLPVMRLLKLTEMRDVSLEEIQRAARCWAREQRTNPKAQSYGNSASFFAYAAKKWLRFHGRLTRPSAPPMRFADQLNYFARYMAEEQGLSPYSVRSHCAKTSKFLEWFGERHRLLTRAKIEDVDEFLAMKGAGGCRLFRPMPTLKGIAQIPSLFRNLSATDWGRLCSKRRESHSCNSEVRSGVRDVNCNPR